MGVELDRALSRRQARQPHARARRSQDARARAEVDGLAALRHGAGDHAGILGADPHAAREARRRPRSPPARPRPSKPRRCMDEQLGKTQYLAGDAFSYGDIPVGIMAYRFVQLVPERPRDAAARALVCGDLVAPGIQGAGRAAILVPRGNADAQCGHATQRDHSASPRSSFGTSPTRPAASRMKKLLQRRQAVDQAEAEVAHEPQQVEPLENSRLRPSVATPIAMVSKRAPALVALEHVGAPGSRPSRAASTIASASAATSLQAHIEPLPGDRMDDMRGVADERERSATKRARPRSRADRRGAARPPSISPRCRPKRRLELGVEIVVGQRDDALGLAASPRSTRSRSGGRRGRLQRQDRERAGGQEMLLGAAIVIALVRDGGDDGGLAVGPAVPRDAGLLADRRARAVGGDQQPRRNRRRHPTSRPSTRCALMLRNPADRRRQQRRRPRRSPSRPAPRARRRSRPCGRTARPARLRRRR